MLELIRPVDVLRGQIVEFTPSRPRRYYLVLITDAGSVPYSTTIYPVRRRSSAFAGIEKAVLVHLGVFGNMLTLFDRGAR